MTLFSTRVNERKIKPMTNLRQSHHGGERSGRYVAQISGYSAFVPRPLPPDPAISMDGELEELLSLANLALGRLDGSAEILPSSDLFVSMYVLKEAVLSSQIEGTQASMVDVLEYGVSAANRHTPYDVSEVVNYVRAMNYGLERLDTLPLSNRLLREIHRELLRDVRGAGLSPGEFRRSQNWIGPPGCTLAEAAFVPPAPHDMETAMGQLELYMHDPAPMPPLVKCALLHSQFETIHPFLDGNGRLGRLLITFYLCQQGVLQRPLLYLSAYFKEHREEYYARLQAVRDSGAWEEWVKFFLNGIRHVSVESTDTIREILRMREEHRRMISQHVRGSTQALQLLDVLYQQPVVSVQDVRSRLGVSYPTANNALTGLRELGLLDEITGRTRNRVFAYRPYLRLLRADDGA